MPSLVVIVFALQLAIHLVNTFGATTVNNLLWALYNLLPTKTAKLYAEQKEYKKNYFRLKQDLNATSSQDEFAKWAKLRRQHDKVLEQYESHKANLDSTKATFDTTVSTLRWLGTNGVRTLLQFVYQKDPMVWLPQGFLPYYAEWLLSFPRAPLGSVSIQIWAMACMAFIKLASDGFVALFALEVFKGMGSAQQGKGQPMKVAAQTGEQSDKTKKEL